MTAIASCHPRLYRRTFVRLTVSAAALSASGALLAACGSSAVPTPTAAAPAVSMPPLMPTVPGAPTTLPATATVPAPVATPAPMTTPATAVTAATSPMPAASAAPATSAAPAPPATTPPMTQMSQMAQAGFIPSPAPNVPDAYTSLPPSFKSVAALPGKGSKVTAFLIGYNPPVPPRAANRYWQELEKRTGITWEPTITPAASYVEKLTGIVASGDVPDLTFLQLEYAPGQNRLMLQGAYTDLTPYLTGDALKAFPNLALEKHRAQGPHLRRALAAIGGPEHVDVSSGLGRNGWLCQAQKCR